MKGFRGQIQGLQEGETCEGKLALERPNLRLQTKCTVFIKIWYKMTHAPVYMTHPKNCGSSAQFAWPSLATAMVLSVKGLVVV